MRIKLSPEQKLKNIERQKIVQDVFKFSREMIEKFNDLFPVAEHYSPSVNGSYGGYNYYRQQVICKDGDYAHINILYENSYEDFCFRFNKFKVLGAFL
jgi:hypothetical protein